MSFDWLGRFLATQLSSDIYDNVAAFNKPLIFQFLCRNNLCGNYFHRETWKWLSGELTDECQYKRLLVP